MRVTKAALLEAINTALTASETAEADYVAATAVWRTRRKANWLANKQPEWRALRDLITKSLKDGKPVTTSMVNSVLTSNNGRTSYLSDHTFDATQLPPNPIVLDGKKIYSPNPEVASSRNYGRPVRDLTPTMKVGELKALKLFLEGSTDEAFSLESLSRLGFKAPASVFRAAVSS